MILGSRPYQRYGRRANRQICVWKTDYQFRTWSERIPVSIRYILEHWGWWGSQGCCFMTLFVTRRVSPYSYLRIVIVLLLWPPVNNTSSQAIAHTIKWGHFFYSCRETSPSWVQGHSYFASFRRRKWQDRLGCCIPDKWRSRLHGVGSRESCTEPTEVVWNLFRLP